MHRFSFLFGLCFTLWSPPSLAGNLECAGLWYTADKTSIVEVFDCGDGTPCGRVAWVNEARGGMRVDHHNADPSLRGRAMVGITLFEGFERLEEEWVSGEIYNPGNGRTYRAEIDLISNNRLAVSGCLGPVCKKLLWERVAQDEASVILTKGVETSEGVASL